MSEEQVCPACTYGLDASIVYTRENLERFSMDFVEGLPISRGFEAILVVVYHLSKGAQFIPVKHLFTASSVAKIFVEHIIKLHGFS